MAEGFFETLGRLANEGYGVGQSRSTRTPILFVKKPSFELGGQQVLGVYDPIPGTTAPGIDRAANSLFRAYGRTPPAVVATGDREPGAVSETVRHESAHHMLQGAIAERVKAKDEMEWSRGVLGGLSRQSFDYANQIVSSGAIPKGYDADPRSILQESVAYATQQNTPEAVRFLSEIGKQVNITDVLKAGAPGVEATVKAKMTFDQILSVLGAGEK